MGRRIKKGKGGVRLGNTDPKLIRKFVQFLEEIFNIKKEHLRFGLQIFNDIPPNKALSYWKQEIKIKDKQFYKVIISKVRGGGTYKYKSEYGVLCVYFNNIRLKETICKMIESIG